MSKAAVRMISPRHAKDNDLLRMRRGNLSIGDFWLLTDTYRVTIAEQKVGEKPSQAITVPRKEFDRFVDWYMREQKVRVL